MSSRFSNQRLAAAGRTIKQKTLWRGVLKSLEKIRMQQRQLDGVFDCLERRLLATDSHEGFINEHARSSFQFRKRNARIDIAEVICASHYDVRGFLRSGAEKCADPVCRRSHFLYDFLELLDHPARLDHRLLLIEDLRPQFQQIAPNGIARRQRRNYSIK